MKRIAVFILLFLLAVKIFAQPDKDKIVKLHGKKFYLHIVHKGETVYGVSKDFKLAVKDIVLENPKAMDGIGAGDTLRIPLYAPNAVPTVTNQEQIDSTMYIYHKVIAKETLYSLSREYNVSVPIMDSLNPELKDNPLKIGMVLRIPNHNAPQPIANRTANPDTTKERQAFKNLVNGLGNATPAQPAVEGKLLKRYNIVLMLTFSAQEADSVNMTRVLDGAQQLPLLIQIANGFYSGFKLALDSLAMQGFNAELHVYNVPPDSANHRIDSLLSLPSMAVANLIVGPPYPALFTRVAKYAMQHQIPIVSPLSAEINVLKNNPFTSKAVPSAITETEQTADFIALHHRQDNIIIVKNADAANDNFYDVFMKRIKATLSIMEPKGDSVIEAKYTDALDDIGHKLSDSKNNIVVVPYQGASFVPKLVNQLANSKYADNDAITIFGMHNWANMDVLDPNNLDTLHLHFATNEFIDYTDHATIRFIQKYRSTFSAEPLYYAFQGFDVAYYYGTLLKKYGTALQDNLTSEKYKGVHTTFDFYKPDPNGGFENKGIYMLEYKNFTIVKDSL